MRPPKLLKPSDVDNYQQTVVFLVSGAVDGNRFVTDSRNFKIGYRKIRLTGAVLHCSAITDAGFAVEIYQSGALIAGSDYNPYGTDIFEVAHLEPVKDSMRIPFNMYTRLELFINIGDLLNISVYFETALPPVGDRINAIGYLTLFYETV